jgi:hypothetical protein
MNHITCPLNRLGSQKVLIILVMAFLLPKIASRTYATHKETQRVERAHNKHSNALSHTHTYIHTHTRMK